MEITIKATCMVTDLAGVPCRVWEGVTGKGTKCKVFVHRIAVADTEDAGEFRAELEEQMPPSTHIDLRLIV